MDVEYIKLNEDELNKLKKIQLDMLKEFINICNKLKLRYFVIAGTALGAIRHEGFIPWDDDIDIGMPRSEYELFLEKGQQLLSQNLFIQTFKTDPNYPNNFAKIRNCSTTFVELEYKNLNINHGIYIDLFPLDGISEINIKRIVIKIIKMIYNRRISVVFYYPKELYKSSLIKELFTSFLKIVTGFFSLKDIINMRENLLKKYDYDSSVTVVNYCGAWGDKEIVPKDYFGTGVIKNFEDIEVVVPEKYDLYLSSLYGDYKKLPPLEERIGHHYCVDIDFENSYKDKQKGSYD